MLTLEDVAKALELFRHYSESRHAINEIVAMDIDATEIRDTAQVCKVDYHDAAIIEIVHRRMVAAANGKPHIDPVWKQQQVTRIEHYLSSNANPAWKCTLASGETLYIRQNNKAMWVGEGYLDLLDMKLGDVWDADITCYTTPGEKNFLDCQLVVAGGKLTAPAPESVKPKITLNDRQRGVAKWAKDVLKNPHIIIFDTETTGLNEDDEIVEIAVIAPDEKVIYQSYIQPIEPQLLLRPGKGGKCAKDIHGITPEMVTGKPDMRDVLDDVRDAMGGKHWIGYNVDYDVRMLKQAQGAALIAKADFVEHADPLLVERCVMRKYAEFAGVPGLQNGSYRWHSLDDACKAMAVKTDDLKPHSAAGDAIATLRLLKALAALDDGTPF